jgi:hypothetical protein
MFLTLVAQGKVPMPLRPILIASLLFAAAWCAWAADLALSGNVVDMSGAAIGGSTV